MDRPAAVPIGYWLTASACLIFAARMLTQKPSLVLGAVGVVMLIIVLRRWPEGIWAMALAVSLFFPEAVRRIVAFNYHGTSVYLADLIPLVFIAAALTSGRPSMTRKSGRAAVLFAALLVAIIALAVYRTLHTLGVPGILQARHLWPFVLVPALPFGRNFASLSSSRIVSTLSVCSIGLCVRSLYLLETGHQARVVPGVQRIFQTWEPFIAAAIGLTIFGYVLASPKVRTVHVVGLVATAPPILFSFFRTAWVFTALVGACMFVLVRGAGRRPRILAAALACAAVAAFATGASSGGGGPSYEQQLATRIHEISPTLDSYRSREYAAVWAEIKAHPLLGSGFGTEYKADWTPYRIWAHNAYEWLWWRLGLIGVLAFVAMQAAVLAGAYRAIRTSLNDDDRGLAIGLTGALVFTLAAANLHENFENYQTNLIVALALAQLIVLARRKNKSDSERVER